MFYSCFNLNVVYNLLLSFYLGQSLLREWCKYRYGTFPEDGQNGDRLYPDTYMEGNKTLESQRNILMGMLNIPQNERTFICLWNKLKLQMDKDTQSKQAESKLKQDLIEAKMEIHNLKHAKKNLDDENIQLKASLTNSQKDVNEARKKQSEADQRLSIELDKNTTLESQQKILLDIFKIPQNEGNFTSLLKAIENSVLSRQNILQISRSRFEQTQKMKQEIDDINKKLSESEDAETKGKEELENLKQIKKSIAQ